MRDPRTMPSVADFFADLLTAALPSSGFLSHPHHLTVSGIVAEIRPAQSLCVVRHDLFNADISFRFCFSISKMALKR